jgi:hypothetical protein
LIFENFFLQCGHHLRMVPLAVTRVLKWHVEFHRPAPPTCSSNAPPAPQTGCSTEAPHTPSCFFSLLIPSYLLAPLSETVCSCLFKPQLISWTNRFALLKSILNQDPTTSPPLTVSTDLRIQSFICSLYLQVTFVPVVDLFIPRCWVQVFCFGLVTYTGQQLVS